MTHLIKKRIKGDLMKNDVNKVDFDLSTLTLNQLIEVYQNIIDFLQFLSENKIVLDEKVDDE